MSLHTESLIGHHSHQNNKHVLSHIHSNQTQAREGIVHALQNVDFGRTERVAAIVSPHHRFRTTVKDRIAQRRRNPPPDQIRNPNPNRRTPNHRIQRHPRHPQIRHTSALEHV